MQILIEMLPHWFNTQQKKTKTVPKTQQIVGQPASSWLEEKRIRETFLLSFGLEPHNFSVNFQFRTSGQWSFKCKFPFFLLFFFVRNQSAGKKIQKFFNLFFWCLKLFAQMSKVKPTNFTWVDVKKSSIFVEFLLFSWKYSTQKTKKKQIYL